MVVEQITDQITNLEQEDEIREASDQQVPLAAVITDRSLFYQFIDLLFGFENHSHIPKAHDDVIKCPWNSVFDPISQRKTTKHNFVAWKKDKLFDYLEIKR